MEEWNMRGKIVRKLAAAGIGESGCRGKLRSRIPQSVVGHRLRGSVAHGGDSRVLGKAEEKLICTQKRRCEEMKCHASIFTALAVFVKKQIESAHGSRRLIMRRR